jgi:hypothetical protein
MLGLIVKALVAIMQTYSIYPPEMTAGLSFFGKHIMRLDFTVVNIGACIDGAVFLLGFEIIYFTVRIIVSFVNWIRGAGPIKV